MALIADVTINSYHLLVLRLKRNIKGISKDGYTRDKLFTGHLCKVQPLVSTWVIFPVILNIKEEFPCSSLLKQSHQRRLESFHISRRNFVDLGTR